MNESIKLLFALCFLYFLHFPSSINFPPMLTPNIPPPSQKPRVVKMLTFYFDDTFMIEKLDLDGKKFDKVSRIVARSEKRGVLLHLDVNTEIYPMHEKEKFLMVLSCTLNYSGAPVTKEAEKSLADKFEYIMHGLLYKMDHRRSDSSDGGSKSPPLVEVYEKEPLHHYKEHHD